MTATRTGMDSKTFYLWRGDRVCFYGDSITEQQMYTVYVEAFIRTRFPKLEVQFFNRGWGGDTSWGEAEGGPPEIRSKRDVEPLDPTVVTIMLGMNDGGYAPFDPNTLSRLETEYNRMHGCLKAAAPNARFTLIRTSPWDDYTRDPNGYNDALLRYGKIVEDAAARSGDKYVDFNLPMVDVLLAARDDDLEFARWILPDLFHPGPPGHFIMAGELLKGWDAPDLVSSVELGADSAQVLSAVNTQIENFDGKSWTQWDEALPFCVAPEDPAIQLVLRHYNLQESLNREILAVTGLAAGDFRLDIDEMNVGTFSATQLAEGINLANHDTPMRLQSLEVLALAQKRSGLQFMRWKEIDVRHGSRKNAKDVSHALGLLEAEVAEEELAKAIPVPHHYRLRKVAE